jgi:hypothetical protein
MSEALPSRATTNTFERIKRINQSGAEFWSARELARVLGYREFRNLSAAIAKAREACTQSGHAVSDHFVLFNEMVGIGSGAQTCRWPRASGRWKAGRRSVSRPRQSKLWIGRRKTAVLWPPASDLCKSRLDPDGSGPCGFGFLRAGA